MALVNSTGTVGQTEDDTYYDVQFGNNRNIQFGSTFTVQHWGVQVSKGGDSQFLATTLRFTNMSPTIPPRSKITSAVLKGVAAITQSGAVTTLIEVLAQDGLWDATPSASIQWRDIDNGIHHGDFRLDVYASGPTLLTTSDIGSGNNFEWELRKVVAGRYERLAQSMQIETAGTLDTIDIQIGKVGAPTGNIWLEVYDLGGSGFPDSLLATSDTVSVATISATTGIHTFVFSGGDQYVFSLDEQFVVVIRGDWTVNDADYVVCRYKLPPATQGGYTLGNAMTYGVGAGFDDQNYPTNQEIVTLASAHPTLFGSWVTPAFVADVEYTTPDISELLQAYINMAGYSEGDPFAVQLSRLTAAQGARRNFKGYDHADTPGVSNQITLEIEWRERAVRVAA